jgi:hypothetical protein
MKEGRGDEYKRRVQGLDRGGVVKTWEELQAGRAPAGWAPGKLLEYLLLQGFQLEGAEVTWPFQVNQPYLREQIDGVVYLEDWLPCLVECKHQREPVEAEPILKLKAQLVRRPRLAVGAVFSTGGFTESAVNLTHLLPPANILLWGKTEIDAALRQGTLRQGMRWKLRYAIERGTTEPTMEDSV